MSKAKSTFGSRNTFGDYYGRVFVNSTNFLFSELQVCDKYGVILGEELTKENCRIEHFALCFGE